MNSETRKTLERLTILSMRNVESLNRRIEQAQDEIAKLQQQITEEQDRIDSYLQTIEDADSEFDREAWVRLTKAEWVV
jgi:predicted  nucleic acid-binding Zn-ribbon protein